MAAGEQQHIAINGAQAANDPVRPGPNLPYGFAPRTSVAKELPPGALLEDLGSRQAVVIAVIPFDKVRVSLRRGAESGQVTRAPGPLQGAGKNMREGPAAKMLAEAAGLVLAAFGERDIS
jgi:hypothetical protein